MSLETLLEAAKYLEYRSEAKARGEEPEDYPSFSQDHLPRPSSSGGSSKHSLSRSPDYHQFDLFFDTVRDKRRIGGAGTREVHNKLEKNRRAHLKECFEMLKKQLPSMDERKTSNLSILRGALRYIQTLKRKERDYEHEMEKLAREKIASQQKLAALKKELSAHGDHLDMASFLPDHDNETTTTASECGAYSEDESAIGSTKNIRQELPSLTRSVSPESISQSSSSSSSSSSEGPSVSLATGVSRLQPRMIQANVAVPIMGSSRTAVPLEIGKSNLSFSTSSPACAISKYSDPNGSTSVDNSFHQLVGTDSSCNPTLVGIGSPPMKFPVATSSKAVSFANSPTSCIQFSAPTNAGGLQLNCMTGVFTASSAGLKVLSTSTSLPSHVPLHLFSSSHPTSTPSLVAVTSTSSTQQQYSSTTAKTVAPTALHGRLGSVVATAAKGEVALLANPATTTLAPMKQNGSVMLASVGKQAIIQQSLVARPGSCLKNPNMVGLQPFALAATPNGLATQALNGIAVYPGVTTARGSKATTILTPATGTQKAQIRHALLSGTAVKQSPVVLNTATKHQSPLIKTLNASQICTATAGQTLSGITRIMPQARMLSTTKRISSVGATPVSVVSNASSSSSTAAGTTSAASLGKVLTATPLLKNVTSLPVGSGLLQPQTLLQPASTMVKPLVVVTMAGNNLSGATLNLPICQ